MILQIDVTVTGADGIPVTGSAAVTVTGPTAAQAFAERARAEQQRGWLSR